MFRYNFNISASFFSTYDEKYIVLCGWRYITVNFYVKYQEQTKMMGIVGDIIAMIEWT